MNKQQREKLNKILSDLEDIKSQVDDFANEEREKFDNLSQSLQETERGQSIEQAADALESAASSLEDAFSSIEEAIND